MYTDGFSDGKLFCDPFYLGENLAHFAVSWKIFIGVKKK